ncbi:hypothetical protein GDO78_000143 [Eleutherodactylus coqui]|uniref:Uncharacterized protein n=1 Tax=Eleutherodactylus coqui TaxID=57060 RepID=A0A8J6KGM3_ELECQ|nr:hypothetical protein GDO78_000143 [Eleutherodactylus coqui]
MWFFHRLPLLPPYLWCKAERKLSVSIFFFKRFILCNSCLCCCTILEAIIQFEGSPGLNMYFKGILRYFFMGLQDKVAK